MDTEDSRMVGAVLLLVMALILNHHDDDRRRRRLPPHLGEMQAWDVFQEMAEAVLEDVECGVQLGLRLASCDRERAAVALLRQVIVSAAAVRATTVRRMGLWYVRPRQVIWWEAFVQHEWSQGQWKKNFRLSKELLWELVNELEPLLEGTGCNAHATLPVHVRVAAYLKRMASGNSHASISELLGIG